MIPRCKIPYYLRLKNEGRKKHGKKDFKVGQEVVLVQRNGEYSIIKGKVSKVGNKYIYVVPPRRWEIKFNISNDFKQVSDGLDPYHLFLTEIEANAYIKRQVGLMRIRKFSQWDLLTNDEIRAIDRIITDRRGALYCAQMVSETFAWVAHDESEESAKETLLQNFNDFFGSDSTMEEVESEYKIETFQIIPGHGGYIEI